MRLDAQVIVPVAVGMSQIRDLVFEAHFTHIRNPEEFLFPEEFSCHKRAHILCVSQIETICTVHAGPCQHNQRPCGTPGTTVGVAFCSRKDNFDRVVGRKLALSRALRHTYDYRIRTGIWVAYLQMIGILPPTREFSRPSEVWDRLGNEQ